MARKIRIFARKLRLRFGNKEILRRLSHGGIAPIALAFLATKAKDVKGAMPYAIGGIVCATIGGICWRCILYVVAISVFAVF